MHGNVTGLNHPDQFGQVLRHCCRNPRCRMKLAQPVDNPRKAFCTPGCHASFYLSRCLVCENAKPSGRSDRKFCNRPKCRSEYHRNPTLFCEKLPTPVNRTDSSRSARKSGTKIGQFEPRTLAIGHDYDREVLRANFRANAKFWNAACLIGPTDPPVNLLGGYKFPDAPDIHLTP